MGKCCQIDEIVNTLFNGNRSKATGINICKIHYFTLICKYNYDDVNVLINILCEIKTFEKKVLCVCFIYLFTSMTFYIVYFSYIQHNNYTTLNITVTCILDKSCSITVNQLMYEAHLILRF